MKRVFGLVLALLVIAVQAWSVQAHANFVRSDPAPDTLLAAAPTLLQTWLGERVADKGSILTLYNATRQPMTSTKAQIDSADPTHVTLPLPSLGPGTYTVAWDTVSADDGDEAQGFFAFTVGATPVNLPGSVSATAKVADLQATLSASSAQAGPNTLDVSLIDPGNRPLKDAQRVTLRIQYLDADLGRTSVILIPAEPGGHYKLSTMLLGLAGRYKIDIQVRRQGLDDAEGSLTWTVQAPWLLGAAQAAPTLAPTSTPAPTRANPATGGNSQPGIATSQANLFAQVWQLFLKVVKLQMP